MRANPFPPTKSTNGYLRFLCIGSAAAELAMYTTVLPTIQPIEGLASVIDTRETLFVSVYIASPPPQKTSLFSFFASPSLR